MSNVNVQQQPKRAAVVIGRFNPPTIGHYAVFRITKKFIADRPELNLHPLPIVMVIEGKKSSEDKKRNPLTAADRISFMRASGKADGVVFETASNAMEALMKVRELGFEPIAIAGGSDRAEKYREMLDKYFTTPTGEKIQHYTVNITRSLKTPEATDEREGTDAILDNISDEIRVGLVSASLARKAVQRGELQKFLLLVGLTGKKEPLGKKLYDKVKKEMESVDVTSG